MELRHLDTLLAIAEQGFHLALERG